MPRGVRASSPLTTTRRAPGVYHLAPHARSPPPPEPRHAVPRLCPRGRGSLHGAPPCGARSLSAGRAIRLGCRERGPQSLGAEGRPARHQRCGAPRAPREERRREALPVPRDGAAEDRHAEALHRRGQVTLLHGGRGGLPGPGRRGGAETLSRGRGRVLQHPLWLAPLVREAARHPLFAGHHPASGVTVPRLRLWLHRPPEAARDNGSPRHGRGRVGAAASALFVPWGPGRRDRAAGREGERPAARRALSRGSRRSSARWGADTPSSSPRTS